MATKPKNDRPDDATPWSRRDTFVWHVDGGELDGTYYRQYWPRFVDNYDGEVVIQYWDE